MSEPQPKAPVQQPIIMVKGLEGITRHDDQSDADRDAKGPDGVLSEAEFLLLGRVRSLVDLVLSHSQKSYL
ncbi:unnamed protein product [Mortierella alpina]